MERTMPAPQSWTVDDYMKEIPKIFKAIESGSIKEVQKRIRPTLTNLFSHQPEAMNIVEAEIANNSDPVALGAWAVFQIYFGCEDYIPQGHEEVKYGEASPLVAKMTLPMRRLMNSKNWRVVAAALTVVANISPYACKDALPEIGKLIHSKNEYIAYRAQVAESQIHKIDMHGKIFKYNKDQIASIRLADHDVVGFQEAAHYQVEDPEEKPPILELPPFSD